MGGFGTPSGHGRYAQPAQEGASTCPTGVVMRVARASAKQNIHTRGVGRHKTQDTGPQHPGVRAGRILPGVRSLGPTRAPMIPRTIRSSTPTARA